MTKPDFATDVGEVMGLALTTEETDAVIILMGDGSWWLRAAEGVDPQQIRTRLLHLATMIEQGEIEDER